MFKKLGIILFAALLVIGVVKSADALYGLEKYWAAVYDNEGNVNTGISSVTVYDVGTTTVATVYSDATGTSLTNPITTGLTDGIFEFYTASSSVDIIATDGVRAKKISGMTTRSPHRIVLIQQIGQAKVLKFTPMNFMALDFAGTTLIPLTASSWPQLQIDNKLLSIVWNDGDESYAQVTFKVPADYQSGGAFRALVDYNTGSDNPEVGYKVYINSDGSTWDTAATVQTPVDPAGTAGKPELVNLAITTDFASLDAEDIVTFCITRDNQESSAADLELYYVEFYYDAKE